MRIKSVQTALLSPTEGELVGCFGSSSERSVYMFSQVSQVS